jgi:acylphosphatase
MITVHLLIEGEVQGVFYRATAKEIADKLGITGWIKNTWEGNVEAMVTGNET